jgi:hypothetical protein
MAYSGTVGTTVIQVQTLIDHGARRCGKLAEELTSEQVLSARESLYFLLSNLINIGIQYWAIDKKVYGLQADQYVYKLPVGGNDVLQALYRRMNRPSGAYATSAGGTVENAFDSNIDTICTQSAPNGNISVNYGTNNPVYIGSIGVLPGVSGSIDCIFTMARLNRDDYTNLPNKNFTANQPFQYWFNRTIPQAEITLWPVPSDPFVQMTVWYSRQIMDVGDLSGELEIPQRWYLAVQSMLAHQMSLELPGVATDRIQYLEGQADKYLTLAEVEERDKSPIYFAPNISVYTR